MAEGGHDSIETLPRFNRGESVQRHTEDAILQDQESQKIDYSEDYQTCRNFLMNESGLIDLKIYEKQYCTERGLEDYIADLDALQTKLNALIYPKMPTNVREEAKKSINENWSNTKKNAFHDFTKMLEKRKAEANEKYEEEEKERKETAEREKKEDEETARKIKEAIENQNAADRMVYNEKVKESAADRLKRIDELARAYEETNAKRELRYEQEQRAKLLQKEADYARIHEKPMENAEKRLEEEQERQKELKKKHKEHIESLG